MTKEKIYIGLLFLILGFVACDFKKQEQENGVISLVPSLTDFAQLVYPHRVVGVSNVCDARSLSEKMPRVGDYKGLDYEKILALKPEKILMLRNLSSPEQIKKLQELNISIQFFEDNTIEDVLNIPVQMDSISGQKIKDSLNVVLKDLLAHKTYASPKYLIMITNEPIQVYGKGNFMTELVDTLGFVNVADQLASPYPVLENEYFIKNLPTIIVTSNAKETKQFLQRKFGALPQYEQIKKILFVEVDDNLLSRSAPRFLELGVTILEQWNKQ